MVPGALCIGPCNVPTVPGSLGSKSPIKIQVLRPSKIVIMTESGDSWPKERYRELVTAIGAVLKDMKIGQFLDGDAITKSTIPSTWQKEVVNTVYLLDVAPWWYLSEQTLGASMQIKWMADRVRWSAGEMRTATRRITRENVAKLVGKVYLSDIGMPRPCS